MTSGTTAGLAPRTDLEVPPREKDDDACWHCGDPADGLDWLTGAPVCESCAALDPSEWEKEASADA